MALNVLVNQENKFRWALFALLLAGLFYIPLNHFHLSPPNLLPMSALDEWVPFVPWTFWIYHSEFAMAFAGFFIARDTVNLSRLIYAFVLLQVIAATVFIFYPTTYPRELFPLDPSTMDPFTYYCFDAFRRGESPASCLPSLHVGIVYLVAFTFWREQREKLPLFLFWATAVAVSTLTTKQHYFVDIIAGLFLAIGCTAVFYRLVEPRVALSKQVLVNKIAD